MKVLLSILIFIVMFAVLLVAIYFSDKYVFKKLKVNKFIPLGVAIICFIAIFLVKNINIYVNIILTVIAALAISWFLSIQQRGSVKVERKIKMKPKAKPNRIKNDKKHVDKK